MDHLAPASRLTTSPDILRRVGVRHPARGCIHFVALAWAAIIACSLIISPHRVAADESLGEVKLSLRQIDPGGTTPSGRPRLAVLLIDRTNSMNWGENKADRIGPGNERRWDVMRTGVRSTLEQLLEHSQGIKVRIRFFDNTTTDYREDDFELLDSPAKIDALMRRLPARAGEGATALYDATKQVADDIRKEHKREDFEWIFFGLFSDGADSNSKKATEASRDEAIEAFWKASVPLVYFAFPIGKDERPSYGPKATVVEIVDIPTKIPKPPQRPATYALELAAGQPKFLEYREPAKPGPYSLAISLADADKVIPQEGMKLAATLASASPLRLTAREFVVRRGESTAVPLDLPIGTDVTKGLSAEIAFESAPNGSPPFACSGTAQFRFAFPADELLPKDKWQDNFPRAIKRNEPATFFLDPGKATNFTWRFTSPSGDLPLEKPREKQFERKFDKVGTWSVEYSCTSQVNTSKVESKKLHDLEVVDAEFHLEPDKVAVDPGANATVTIVPNPGATSKATYKADLDDQPVSVDGNKVTVPEKLLKDDSHYLTVTASVEAGGKTFTFTPQKKIIKVKRAKIVRLKQGQSPLKPGDQSFAAPESLSPGVQSVFQVDDIDQGKVASIFWNYVPPGGKSESKQDPFLTVTPEACGDLVVKATVTLKDGNKIELVENFHVGGVPPTARPKLVPEVTAIGLLGTSVRLDPGIEGTCREARVWLTEVDKNTSLEDPLRFDPRVKQVQVVVPSKLRPGRYHVHLNVIGYPSCEPWTELAPLTLTLTPRRQYELWLLSVAAMGGVGWLLYRWLWNNDPLRWWVDFSFTDPGPPTADSGGSYTLYVGDPTPASAGHRTNYLGWNRWRKHSFVPLWLFAERADSADGAWLNDPRWSENTLKLVNVWKNPFKLTGDLAVNWKSEIRYNDLEGAEPISRTLWLQPPWDGVGDPPAVWMRMHCPRGGDPRLWFLWTWLAITLVAAALLLRYFNIVTF